MQNEPDPERMDRGDAVPEKPAPDAPRGLRKAYNTVKVGVRKRWLRGLHYATGLAERFNYRFNSWVSDPEEIRRLQELLAAHERKAPPLTTFEKLHLFGFGALTVGAIGAYFYFQAEHYTILAYVAGHLMIVVPGYMVFRAFSAILAESAAQGNPLPASLALRWLRNRLPGIRLPLVTVFLAYLAAIVWFGGLYRAIYRDDPKSFLFSSDITNAAAARYLEQASGTLWDLKTAKATTDSLSTKLKDDPLTREREDRDFRVGSATVRFWLYGPGDIPFPQGWAATVTDDHQRKLWEDKIHDFHTDGDEKSFRSLAVKASEHLQRSIDGVDTLVRSQAPKATEIWSYWDFVYFSGITLSTVGYGDILPNTTKVRMVVLGEILVGIILLGFGVTIVASNAGSSGATSDA